jgi:selenocysteine-specific elongation factor
VTESGVDPAVLARLVERGDVTGIAGRAFHRDVLDDLARRAIAVAGAHTTRHPLQWGIDKEELRQRLAFPHGATMFNRVIEALGERHPLHARENRVRAGSPELVLPPSLEQAVGALRERIRDAGVAFLSRDELGAGWPGPDRLSDAVQVLKDRGEVVEVGDGLVHPEAMDRCVGALRRLFAARGEISVGDFKDVLGITRKHAIPLLEFLDSRGVTVRRGNARLPGKGLDGDKKFGD